MDPNPKPDPQDHGKPAGEGGGNSKSSDDAPIIDEDATFRNAAYFGNEEGSKDKDGGSQKNLFRYTRLVVHIVAYFRHASVLPPISPSLRPIDITVVIATRGDEIANLVSGLESHVNAGCRHISICVPSTRLGRVQAEADLFISKQKDLKVYVSHVAQAGKREQLKWAIDSIPDSRRKAHKVIVFADDDITFPHSTYGWVLAPFENPQVGGVGTCQRASRIKAGTIIQRIINWIFADYIERRGVENMATVAIEKSISCLSGRLAAFRAVIVQDRQFLDGLVSETWNGLKLRADDDNFWTRWLLEGGWEIAVQNDERCRVETTFGTTASELRRFVRWQRSNPRSNAKSLRRISNWKYHLARAWDLLTTRNRKFPWAIYALYLSGFVNYGLPMDIALWSLCWKATADSPSQDTLRLGFVSWWLFIKTVKRIRLFRRDVRDVLFLPVCILWGYCHDFIKLYALMTRYEYGWQRVF
ncbi:conserved hypothetical protein [Verticillium alfalfae VaMs.102]|uniref:Polysaccharide synthase Cps1p n=2 Tax=Verticillium TaxID=1036719 RepID=G2X534_VERDV|nr:conserved hypothetical protein [Verticillium alfalfae VaMs.102]XP_009653297.1 uncharacterized protein VDAG_05266 [Verticillium dahliae VdLs.17]EEY24039.1 conserved hypothetical protein [Verticillium alfalfae VaMs.102]EGY23828.1 hypothetical protein VDAG_05266 [Verticillium dahliae VdLs.17]